LCCGKGVESMAYDSKTKNKAFKLFCMGKTLTEISKVKGMPSDKTLAYWRREEKWVELRGTVNTKTSEKLIEKVSDFKADMISELCDIKRILLDEMSKCLNPTKDKLADSIIKLQQQELLLRGEATERKKIDGDIVTRNLDFSNLTTEDIRELLKNEDKRTSVL
jgi:hypothetical protein